MVVGRIIARSLVARSTVGGRPRGTKRQHGLPLFEFFEELADVVISLLNQLDFRRNPLFVRRQRLCQHIYSSFIFSGGRCDPKAEDKNVHGSGLVWSLDRNRAALWYQRRRGLAIKSGYFL